MSNYIKAGQFDDIYQVTVLYPCSYRLLDCFMASQVFVQYVCYFIKTVLSYTRYIIFLAPSLLF